MTNREADTHAINQLFDQIEKIIKNETRTVKNLQSAQFWAHSALKAWGNDKISIYRHAKAEYQVLKTLIEKNDEGRYPVLDTLEQCLEHPQDISDILSPSREPDSSLDTLELSGVTLLEPGLYKDPDRDR